MAKKRLLRFTVQLATHDELAWTCSLNLEDGVELNGEGSTGSEALADMSEQLAQHEIDCERAATSYAD